MKFYNRRLHSSFSYLLALFCVVFIFSYSNPSFSIQPEPSGTLLKREEKVAPYLSCPVLQERTSDFLKYHYIFKKFNTELSKRTFAMYFKMLDPGKNYFLKSDIDSFLPYEANLGQKLGGSNCQFVNSVYELYKKRVQEASENITTLLAKPFNFKVNEFIETDRKKLDWAPNRDVLVDRWRKTLKFLTLNMQSLDTSKTVQERLKKRYALFLKDILARSSDEVNAIFLNAFAQSLDPHSSYFTPLDNDQFQIDFSLKLVGIGATLINLDGYTTIDAVIPGGAAARDGRIKKGDRIVAVDSGDGSGVQDVIDMDLNKVVQLIRGKEGSIVKLVIMRKETDAQMKRFQIQLNRAVVQIKDSEAKSDVLTVDNKKIGIINLPSFYVDYKGCQKNPIGCRSSSNDMLREILKLKGQKVDGIVIDLRKNGGGDLGEAQKIVGLFIHNPVVTQIEDRERQVRSLEVDSEPAYLGPLALLVSKYSASASEIFAGAVQDYGRGLILGDSRTFGKGTVQTVVEIPPSALKRQTDGAIHVTIAKFFRPSGKSNQEKGILADVVIPDLADATDTGEKEYDFALPYTTIPASRDFKPVQQIATLVPTLRQLSSNRVAKSPEFKDLLSNMDKLKKERDNTLVTLKEPLDKKSDKKKGAKSLDPTESDNLPTFSTKVIEKKDFELKESANVLADSIGIVKKPNWAK